MGQMRKLFLTGGTGFFGKSILSMLKRGAAPEYEVTILSRDPAAFLAANPGFSGMACIRWIAGDVRDFAFPQERFDAVIHAAAPAVVTLPPGVMRDVILTGTERVLRFARECGAGKVMFVSSGAVYGPPPTGLMRIPEELPCHPVTEYGIAKWEAEEMCLASGIPAVLPRCFSFVGPFLDRESHYAAGNFLRDALSGGPIIVRGDGSPLRSYLHADDLVEWLFAILERGRAGRPYNVGSPEAVSIAELAELIASCVSPPPEIRVLGGAAPGTGGSRYVPDVSRAERELGLHNRCPLKEAILRTLAGIRGIRS